jgi:hypothetical protein
VGGEEHGLERVGRPRRPAVWLGAWLVGLVFVVAMALAGRAGPTDGLAVVPEASAAPSPTPAPLATASPSLPVALPRIIRPLVARVPLSPRPSPTLGDDGLVGGTVYSSAAPADWFERSARANGR